MSTEIKSYVENLFKDAPQTQKIQEMKEELLSNLSSRYEDLLVQGETKEEAYNKVIAGIGDLSELFRQIENESAFNRHYPSPQRKKNALLVSIAVILYILAIPAAAITDEFSGRGTFTPLVFFLFIAVATGILVYNHLSRPKYIKENESLVEEFKQWKSQDAQRQQLRRTLSSILWLVIIIAYFGVSFFWSAWAYSWLLFVFGALMQVVLKLIFDLGEYRK